MQNEIRISTFGIRHELGPMYLDYRNADGTYAQQLVNDGPVLVSLAQIPARIRTGFAVSSLEIMEQNLHQATDDDLRAFREALQREDMVLGLVGISRCAGDSNAAHRSEDVATIKDLIDTSGRLGAQQVRVVLLPPPIVPSPTPAPFDDLVDTLRHLAEHARDAGVRLTVENDDPITCDPNQLLPILDAVGGDVGLVLDTGNLEPIMSEVAASFREGREPHDISAEPAYQTIRMLLPRAEVVHVKTYGFEADGSAKVYDLDRVLQILVDGGFRGPITIEYAGADGAAADAAIARTIDLVREA